MLRHLHNNWPGLFNECVVLIVKFSRTSRYSKHECVGVIINKCCKDPSTNPNLPKEDNWEDASASSEAIEFDDDMDNQILHLLKANDSMQDLVSEKSLPEAETV